MAVAEWFLYSGIALAVLSVVIVLLKTFGSTKIKRGLAKASHQLHLG